MTQQNTWKEQFESKFVNVYEEHSEWKKSGKNADLILQFIEEIVIPQERLLAKEEKAEEVKKEIEAKTKLAKTVSQFMKPCKYNEAIDDILAIPSLKAKE